MDFILARTLETRLTVMFVVGACVGSAVNWAIYRLAWNRRAIGPWSRPDPSAPRRSVWDRLPILGWFGLRREAALHGAGFWIRPMLIELAMGLGFAWLYWWEIGQTGLLPSDMVGAVPRAWLASLHFPLAVHCVLIAWMLAASMIDIDETCIPDEITVSGTLVGLLLAAALPRSLLPLVVQAAAGRADLTFLRFTSPNGWPVWLEGMPQTWSLVLGLACWWLWCAALLPRTWYTRHGWWRAIRLCWSRIANERTSYRILRMAVVGTLAIALVWSQGRAGWEGLLSALIGMAAGGGLIWLVRIIAAAALQREAMGFGDVTLMAMIGAFVGWQSAIVVFFLAPLAGVAIGLLRLVLFRDREIPYGPFLCLATLTLIVQWSAIWDYTFVYFAMGWLVPVVMLVCLPMMGLLLGLWRLILRMFL